MNPVNPVNPVHALIGIDVTAPWSALGFCSKALQALTEVHTAITARSLARLRSAVSIMHLHRVVPVLSQECMQPEAKELTRE